MRGYPPRCVTSKSIRLDEFCDACQPVGSRPFSIASVTDKWWEQLNIPHVLKSNSLMNKGCKFSISVFFLPSSVRLLPSA